MTFSREESSTVTRQGFSSVQGNPRPLLPGVLPQPASPAIYSLMNPAPEQLIPVFCETGSQITGHKEHRRDGKHSREKGTFPSESHFVLKSP